MGSNKIDQKLDKKKSTNLHGLRIAFIIGHTNLRPGVKNLAESAENHYHNQIMNDYFCCPDSTDFVYDVYRHNSYNLGYHAMCKSTSKRINAEIEKNGKYDVIFALHFNAAESRTAHGAEVLHYFSNDNAAHIGRVYLKKLKQEFESRNRGLKPLYKGSHRGYWELYYPKSTVVTLEPFFSTNKETFKFTTKRYGQWLRKFVDNLYV